MSKGLASRLGPWWGRFGGVTFGTALLGWPGSVGGFVVGVFIDRRLRLRRYAPARWSSGDRTREQRAALVSTFAVAGQVAKADGRVSEREIALARRVMAELSLTGPERRHAIAMFTHGKQPDFPLVSLVRRFRRLCGDDAAAVERFLDVQLRMALADGQPGERQLHVLQAVGASLLISADAIDERLRERSARMGRGRRALAPRVEEAYALLEVRECAGADEIRRAYRRMIGRYHPDRLEGRGETPEAIQQAAARTHEIRAAFDEIRRVRGF
ncbi:co-chaperone DjlA [Ectothiorhodospiraceae bacterium WFHF3C12]|nr:co-chaperone DjlA [Ectothiorhodospiraceae bacterium WFHF3C12]